MTAIESRVETTADLGERALALVIGIVAACTAHWWRRVIRRPLLSHWEILREWHLAQFEERSLQAEFEQQATVDESDVQRYFYQDLEVDRSEDSWRRISVEADSDHSLFWDLVRDFPSNFGYSP